MMLRSSVGPTEQTSALLCAIGASIGEADPALEILAQTKLVKNSSYLWCRSKGPRKHKTSPVSDLPVTHTLS